MVGRKWNHLGAIAAAALTALAAAGAEAGPRLYDLKVFFGPDSFATQFWGQAQGVVPLASAPPAPAPSLLRSQIVPAPAPVPVQVLPAPAAVPVQVLPAPAAPPVAAAELERGLRPIPPIVDPASPGAVPVEIRTQQPAGFLPSITGRYMVGNFGIASYAEASNSGGTVDHKTSYDSGIAVQFALGYEWDPRWDLEAEFALRNAAAGTITPSGGTAGTATGTLLTMSFMANGVRGFEMRWPVTPYFIFGGGFARVTARSIDAAGVSKTDSTNWALAYQFAGGFDYPLSAQWSVDASYRYFATTKPDFTNAENAAYKSTLAVHNFLVGTRYRF